MSKTITGSMFLILFILSFVVAGCTQKLTLATDVLYEGPLMDDGEYTYVSAGEVVERCLAVKECMGLADKDYPLPNIIGLGGGNAVECGLNDDGTPKLKRACYKPGTIIATQGSDLEFVDHECVHHWLYEDTGDLDAKHTSPYLLDCVGIKLEQDAE